MTKPQGLIVWFTGLSGAGKTTLSRRIAQLLSRPVEVFDGDEVRKQLSPELGFSKADRDLNVRRIGYVARAVARTGAVAICAAISPYAAARDEVRALAISDGVRFIEIALHAPHEVLAGRDTRGLYASGPHPYEPPRSPELRLDTSLVSEDACVAAILRVLE